MEASQKKPKKLTREELASFLPNPRAIRVFEQLLDIVPQDILDIYRYLINTITIIIDDFIVTEDTDTLRVNTTAKDIHIYLVDLLLDGKVLNIKFFAGVNHCYIHGNIDGVSSDIFELFLGESLTLQYSDFDKDWCII